MPPTTPRPLKCSVGRRHGTPCGLSARYPTIKEYVALNSCNRDVSVHLRNLNMFRSNKMSESHLILLRIGIFSDEISDMTVCPKHRDCLGLSWRPSRICAHPQHGQNKGRCDRGVSREMSLEIKETWDVLVPIGSSKQQLLYMI